MQGPLHSKRILFTSGPTSVAIDAMRVITNRSTGEMGRLIANACAKQGARVTLLEGAVTTDISLVKSVKVRKFFFFDELDVLLKLELKKRPDAVIHAAAVADFRPEKIFKGKISSGDKVTLDLVATKKLIVGIRSLAPDAIIVGFKLEPTLVQSVREARGLLMKADCDLVIANAFGKGGYQAALVSLIGVGKVVNSKSALVKQLIDLLTF